MKFIHRLELDKKAWDALVTFNRVDVFSYSWYLDACAIDWCVLVDDNFENGIALPYNTKLGIKSIYPPMFSRNLDFLGKDLSFRAKALQAIMKAFPAGHLQLLEPVKESVVDDGAGRVFQQITGNFELNKQATRMLQKSKRAGLEVRKTTDWRAVLEIIRTELSEKISEFNAENLERLRQLMVSLEKENRLFCLGIFREDKLEGGMVFMETEEKRVYLKGAAHESARNAGGMYLSMEKAIGDTISDNRIFDFGGSGVEGVRRFNRNLGGSDRHYYIYTWNHAPRWFNLIKLIYQKWKKK